MQRFLRAGELDPRPVVTHRFPLERIADAIAVIKDGSAGKVILEVDAMTLLDTRLEAPELEQFGGTASTSASTTSTDRRGRGRRWRDAARSSSFHRTTISGSATSRRWLQAGKEGLDRYGAGTASVRFICGTFTMHRELEAGLARLVGTPASLTFVSCWNANEAVPGTLLGEEDLVLSDQLNHASIIDGVRLAKAITKCQTGVYHHANMADLDARLAAAKDRRIKMVITDGVFSMEGAIAHAARPRRHLPEARGGACRGRFPRNRRAGGHGPGYRRAFRHGGTGGHHHLDAGQGARRGGRRFRGGVRGSLRLPDPAGPAAALLQRPSPHGGSQRPGERALSGGGIRNGLPGCGRMPGTSGNSWASLGFKPLSGETPIVPVILGETADAIRMSEMLLEEGVFVTGFGYPVVPQGQARVRCQVSAAHTRADLDQALSAFAQVGRRLKLI